jgi:hypothetical protein
VCNAVKLLKALIKILDVIVEVVNIFCLAILVYYTLNLLSAFYPIAANIITICNNHYTYCFQYIATQ